MINGINLNDASQNQITFQPSINTTAEVKISNSIYSPNTAGLRLIVNVATRSGTNSFHGEGFDYLRNNYFDARNYFNRRPARQNSFIRNNFGGAFSGPVWKDHTFFFLSYEGLRQHQALLFNGNVPSPSQRPRLPQAKPDPPTPKSSISFPRGITQPARFSGVSPGPVTIDQFSGDLFHTVSSKDNLHAYYAWQQDARTEPNLQGNTIPGFGDHRPHTARLVRSTRSISSLPTWSTKRVGLQPHRNRLCAQHARKSIDFGIQNGVTYNNALPQITVQDLNLNFGGPSAFPQGRFDTTGVFSDTLSWTRGGTPSGQAESFVASSATPTPRPRQAHL